RDQQPAQDSLLTLPPRPSDESAHVISASLLTPRCYQFPEARFDLLSLVLLRPARRTQEYSGDSEGALQVGAEPGSQCTATVSDIDGRVKNPGLPGQLVCPAARNRMRQLLNHAMLASTVEVSR